MILRLCSLWLKTAEGWAGLVGAEGPAQVRWGNISDHEPMEIMMSCYNSKPYEGSTHEAGLFRLKQIMSYDPHAIPHEQTCRWSRSLSFLSSS